MLVSADYIRVKCMGTASGLDTASLPGNRSLAIQLVVGRFRETY